MNNIFLKSRLIIVVMVVFGITAFMSCEKKGVGIDYSVLEKAGKEHNQGLDYVLNKLKISKKNKNFNSNDVYSIIKENTIDFLQTKSEIVNTSNVDLAIRCANEAFDWIESQNNSKSTHNSNLWYESIEDSLSIKQKELLSILYNAINNPDLDLNATLSVFTEVKERAETELDEKDQIAIIAAVEIGSNSMVYWNENIDEWADVLSSGNKSIKKWFNWKKVGAADVQGGVTGAVTGGITGGLAGAGTGALAGGLGASAGNAAKQLWNHWVN